MVTGAVCLAIGIALIGISIALKAHEDLVKNLAEIKKINDIH